MNYRSHRQDRDVGVDLLSDYENAPPHLPGGLPSSSSSSVGANKHTPRSYERDGDDTPRRRRHGSKDMTIYRNKHDDDDDDDDHNYEVDQAENSDDGAEAAQRPRRGTSGRVSTKHRQGYNHRGGSENHGQQARGGDDNASDGSDGGMDSARTRSAHSRDEGHRALGRQRVHRRRPSVDASIEAPARTRGAKPPLAPPQRPGGQVRTQPAMLGRFDSVVAPPHSAAATAAGASADSTAFVSNIIDMRVAKAQAALTDLVHAQVARLREEVEALKHERFIIYGTVLQPNVYCYYQLPKTLPAPVGSIERAAMEQACRPQLCKMNTVVVCTSRFVVAKDLYGEQFTWMGFLVFNHDTCAIRMGYIQIRDSTNRKMVQLSLAPPTVMPLSPSDASVARDAESAEPAAPEPERDHDDAIMAQIANLQNIIEPSPPVATPKPFFFSDDSKAAE